MEMDSELRNFHGIKTYEKAKEYFTEWKDNHVPILVLEYGRKPNLNTHKFVITEVYDRFAKGYVKKRSVINENLNIPDTINFCDIITEEYKVFLPETDEIKA